MGPAPRKGQRRFHPRRFLSQMAACFNAPRSLPMSASAFAPTVARVNTLATILTVGLAGKEWVEP